jgi:hypothetical protein
LYLCVCVQLLACREAPIDPLAKERRGPLVTAEQPPLREDPAAGKRSEEQWRRHLAWEEVERKMAFDRNHAAEHRALIVRLKQARERLDRPKTPSELEQTRKAIAPTLTELQASIDGLDKWKNSSQLHTDYAALMTALSDGYPAARLAAMGGATESLTQERQSFDAHLRAMHAWLDRLEKDDDEALEEGGGE